MQLIDVGKTATRMQIVALVNIVCSLRLYLRVFLSLLRSLIYCNAGFDTGSNCGHAFYDGTNHNYCGTTFCGEFLFCSGASCKGLKYYS